MNNYWRKKRLELIANGLHIDRDEADAKPVGPRPGGRGVPVSSSVYVAGGIPGKEGYNCTARLD